jgi:hypothetical protein
MRDLDRRSPLGLMGLALLAALCLPGSVGCGGGSGSPQASSCQAACSRCGGDFCIDCAATSARFRNEFETAVYACVLGGSDASCDVLWTSCFVQAAGQLSSRPVDASYRSACLAKRSECASAGTNFADDNCLQSPLLEESRVAQAQQCLSLSCPAIAACFRPLFN